MFKIIKLEKLDLYFIVNPKWLIQNVHKIVGRRCSAKIKGDSLKQNFVQLAEPTKVGM